MVQNPAVRNPPGLWTTLSDPAAHTADRNVRAWRPLRTLAFQIESRLFGDQPSGYHAVNLVLHALAAWLAWRLTAMLLPSEPFSPGLALLGAVILAVHPLQVEVAASIKSQDDLLSAVFQLALLNLLAPHLIARPRPSSDQARNSSSGLRASACATSDDRDAPLRGEPSSARAGLGADAPHGAAMALAAFLMFLAILSKENAMLAPLLAALFPLFLAQGAGCWRNLRNTLSLLAGVAIAAFAFRAWALYGIESAAMQRAEAGAGSIWLFPSSIAFAPLYAYKAFCPASLSVDYGTLPILSFSSPWVWISLSAQAVVAAGAMASGRPMMRLGLAWFYLTLLPSLNLVTGYQVFAERFAYLPLIGLVWVGLDGLAVAAAWVEGRLREGSGRAFAFMRAGVAGLLVVMTAALMVRSRVRAAEWRDNETLFRAALRVSPGSGIMRRFLVDELLRQGRLDEAAALIDEAGDKQAALEAPLETGDGAVTPPTSAGRRARMAQLGILSLMQGENERAATLFRAILDSPFAVEDDAFNLGTALLNVERFDEARLLFSQSLAKRPGDAKAMRMLGRLELEAGDPAASRRWFVEAIRVERSHPLNWYFLVLSTWKSEGEAAAVEAAREAGAAGIDLRPLAAEGRMDWTAAGEELRTAIGLGP